LFVKIIPVKFRFLEGFGRKGGPEQGLAGGDFGIIFGEPPEVFIFWILDFGLEGGMRKSLNRRGNGDNGERISFS
jgi:hypothetical protein